MVNRSLLVAGARCASYPSDGEHARVSSVGLAVFFFLITLGLELSDTKL